MATWRVKATWREDEVEASEQWEVNAATAHDAVKVATTHMQFRPYHVEARLISPESKDAADDLAPGHGRRVPPG
jgi:hypothetical protein